MPLNNEIDIIKVDGIDNDIRDSYTRAMIAGEETTTTATHQYSKGDYFIWTDRQLYKAKTDISVGDTLALNTNVEEAGDVTDEISKINKTMGDLVTVTGNPLSFETDSEQLAQDVVITFEPIQSGSGDPSPSNVRQISGYDEISLITSKKNLILDTLASATIASNGLIDSHSEYKMSLAIVRKGIQYTVKSNEGLVCGFFYSKPTVNARSYNASRTDTTNTTFTAPINGWVAFRSSSSYETPQIEIGSESTTYEAPNILTNITLELDSTIYGGTLNVENGELVVDRGIVDLGDLTWEYRSNSYFRAASPIYFKPYLGNTEAICSCYKYIGSILNADSMLSADNNSIAVHATVNNIVYIKDTSYSNATDLKNSLSGQKLVFKLETPITYHLTPHQVRLLQGANVVTTNGISMTLKYRKGEIAKLEDLSEVSAFAEEVSKSSYTYADNAKNGSKNHNSYPYRDTTCSANGITFTDLGDGRVFIGGPSAQTASGNTYFVMHKPDNTPFTLKKGHYRLTGLPKGGSSNTYNMYISYGGNAYLDIGDGVDFIITEDTNPELAIKISSGTTIPAGGIIVEPMISDAKDTDPTWAPYAMTNRELTDNSVNKSDITYVESGNTASRYYPSDLLIYVKNKLYRTKTSINSGTAFSIGTNIEEYMAAPQIFKSVTYTNFTLASGASKTLTRTSDIKLPYAYMIISNGSQGATLSIRVGTGYGEQSARHYSAPILGTSSSITVTIDNTTYGLTITNSTPISVTICVVDLGLH